MDPRQEKAKSRPRRNGGTLSEERKHQSQRRKIGPIRNMEKKANRTGRADQKEERKEHEDNKRQRERTRENKTKVRQGQGRDKGYSRTKTNDKTKKKAKT
jgi:hypothetical protein